MTIIIPAIFKKQYKAYRLSAGSYVGGRWVAGAETSFTVTGSLQPMKANELLLLPEGIRTKDIKKLYTGDELVTADEANNIEADEIEVAGVRFKVHKDSEHDTGHSAHNKVLLIRKNP